MNNLAFKLAGYYFQDTKVCIVACMSYVENARYKLPLVGPKIAQEAFQKRPSLTIKVPYKDTKDMS